MLASTHQQLQKGDKQSCYSNLESHDCSHGTAFSLKRAAELIGMTAYCDFMRQVSVDHSRQRTVAGLI